MRELVLRLTSLAKTVPGGRRLFDGLALTLEAGERVAIRGESGAGKSTLLNIIAGLDTADSGEVMVAGTDLARLDDVGQTALRRDAIGFVFQAFHILPHLDLARNVAFPLILQKQPRTSALERAGSDLPGAARLALSVLVDTLRSLDIRIGQLDRELARRARDDEE